MTVAFNNIPLNNGTGCTLQLDPWECGTEPLSPGAATVVNCTSVGITEVNNGTYYAWTTQATLSPGTFCSYTACGPQQVIMTCWLPRAGPGEIAQAQSFTAEPAERAAPSAKG